MGRVTCGLQSVDPNVYALGKASWRGPVSESVCLHAAGESQNLLSKNLEKSAFKVMGPVEQELLEAMAVPSAVLMRTHSYLVGSAIVAPTQRVMSVRRV